MNSLVVVTVLAFLCLVSARSPFVNDEAKNENNQQARSINMPTPPAPPASLAPPALLTWPGYPGQDMCKKHSDCKPTMKCVGCLPYGRLTCIPKRAVC